MYVKSTRPSAKREVQKERIAKRDDQIARPRRAQTCERSAPWECAREAGRFYYIILQKQIKLLDLQFEYFWIIQSARLDYNCFEGELDNFWKWKQWNLINMCIKFNVYMKPNYHLQEWERLSLNICALKLQQFGGLYFPQRVLIQWDFYITYW